MKVSDLMQAMSAAGAPMEAILIAIRALEEQSAIVEQKRAVERDRKRRQRANYRDMDGTVTGPSRDTDGTVPSNPPLSRPPNDIYSNPPTHTPPETKTRARKGTRLPVDWEPATLPSNLDSVVCQWPASAVPRELSKFRDWAAGATGTNAVKADWDAAWRNWLRKAEEDGRYGRQISGGSAGAGSTDPLIASILAKKAAREAHAT